MTRRVGGLIPTQRSLLSKLKNWDDQQSWQEFFDTYWKLIYGVARTLGINAGQVYLAKHRVARLVQKEIKSLSRNLI